MDYWYRLLKVCFHFVSSCLKRDPCGHYTNRGDCSQTNTNLKGGGAGTARKMWPIHSKQTDKWVSSRSESHLWILIVKTKFLRSKAWLIWLFRTSFDMQASIESDLYREKNVSCSFFHRMYRYFTPYDVNTGAGATIQLQQKSSFEI